MVIASKKVKIFRGFNYGGLTLLGLMFLLPYALIISASFTAEAAFLKNGYSLIPAALSVDAYKVILAPEAGILRAFLNSVIITASGTALQVIVTSLAAYALSKKRLAGRGAIMGVIIFSMLFSGGLIPSYIWIAGKLQLRNNYLAVILPAMFSPWSCILARNYFQGIPAELDEAATIDGCGQWRMFLTVFVPVSVPIIATITLFSAVDFWNAWAGPALYFDSNHRDMLPLTAILREMIQQEVANSGGGRGVSETVKAAVIVAATLPIIMVYPFIQKYFMSGLMLGSVKG